METLQLLLLTFLAGLTACGIGATICELVMRQEVRFAEPFVSTGNLQRSVLVAVAAGPFMLLNDALAARRSGDISRATLVLCGAGAAFWLTAVGVVLLALASAVAGPPA